MNVIKAILIIFSLILVILIGDYYIRVWQRRNVVIEISARSLSTSGPDTFHFVLLDDRTLISSVGIRRISSLQREDFKAPLFTRSIFETVHETVDIQITKEEFSHLLSIANRLPIDGEREEFFSFSRGFLNIYYDGALFKGQYPVLPYPYTVAGVKLSYIMNDLLDEVVELSPLLDRLP